jgi:hypothetical protein
MYNSLFKFPASRTLQLLARVAIYQRPVNSLYIACCVNDQILMCVKIVQAGDMSWIRMEHLPRGTDPMFLCLLCFYTLASYRLYFNALFCLQEAVYSTLAYIIIYNPVNTTADLDLYI